MTTEESKPQTTNSVSVETPQGYKTFSLVHGDITQMPTDLLVLSAYGDGKPAIEGQVVEALRKRHGVTVAHEPRWLNLSERCWTCFQTHEVNEPFSAVLTVFISQLAWDDDPLPIVKEAVEGVFASLAALEYKGDAFTTVSLPVLYGHRILTEHSKGVDIYPQFIEVLIRQALRWLKQSDQTQTVQFVVFEEKQLAAWDEAIDRAMGRSVISTGSDAVLASLCQEIVAAIHSRPDARLAGAAEHLGSALAHQDRLSIENVCVWGRKLVEAMLVVLLPGLGTKKAQNLMSNINVLELSKDFAPWITSYMHALRIFGNESVHVKGDMPGYHPSRLDKGDLVSALSAIRALLSAWPEMAAKAETKDTKPAAAEAGIGAGGGE